MIQNKNGMEGRKPLHHIFMFHYLMIDRNLQIHQADPIDSEIRSMDPVRAVWTPTMNDIGDHPP